MELQPKENWELIPDDRLIVEALKNFQTPEQIEALEAEMLECANSPIMTKHHFGAGVYSREIFMPKGTIAIGHAHTEECLNIVISGSVSVLIEGEIKRVTGPCTFTSAPFSRKVGYVHEDIIWITVHPIGTRSIDKIEAQLFAKSESFKKFEERVGSTAIALASMNADDCFDDRFDYLEVLKEAGLTQQDVDVKCLSEEDMVDMPEDWSAFTHVGTSRIHKNGVMCGPFHFTAGEMIGPARIGDRRTNLGRYTNHSRHPNCYPSVINGDIYLIAKKPINPDSEITIDYREALIASAKADQHLNQLSHTK